MIASLVGRQRNFVAKCEWPLTTEELFHSADVMNVTVRCAALCVCTSALHSIVLVYEREREKEGKRMDTLGAQQFQVVSTGHLEAPFCLIFTFLHFTFLAALAAHTHKKPPLSLVSVCLHSPSHCLFVYLSSRTIVQRV